MSDSDVSGMILGSCPYEDCDAPLTIWSPMETPKFERHECEGCHRIIWTRHSRLDPWSSTEADFLNEYEVDEATKSITERNPPASLTPEQARVIDDFCAEIGRMFYATGRSESDATNPASPEEPPK